MAKHENLATALAAVQAELPKLRKTETAKVTGESKGGGKVNYSYGYAGLDEVVETVLPVLGAHGLSVTSKSTYTDAAGFILEVTLLHEAGEREVGVWPLPDPRRGAGAQDIGSAMTYGRRYLTLALTGTFPGGEDDDGAQAQKAARDARSITQDEFNQLSRERPKQAGPEPTAAEPPAPKKTWTDEEVAGLTIKLITVDLEKLGAAYDWMASRDLHNRQLIDENNADRPYTATEVVAVRLATVARDPQSTGENISWLRDFADARGLLKTPVTPKANLGEVLTEQKDARVAAVVAQSDNAQEMRTAAADSWDDEKHPQPTPEQDGGAQ